MLQQKSERGLSVGVLVQVPLRRWNAGVHFVRCEETAWKLKNPLRQDFIILESFNGSRHFLLHPDATHSAIQNELADTCFFAFSHLFCRSALCLLVSALCSSSLAAPNKVVLKSRPNADHKISWKGQQLTSHGLHKQTLAFILAIQSLSSAPCLFLDCETKRLQLHTERSRDPCFVATSTVWWCDSVMNVFFALYYLRHSRWDIPLMKEIKSILQTRVH